MGIVDFPTEIFKALRCLAVDSAKTRLKLPISSRPASTYESDPESKRSLTNESTSSVNKQETPINATPFQSTEEKIAEKQATKQPASESMDSPEFLAHLRSRRDSEAKELLVKRPHLVAAGRDFLHVVNEGFKFLMIFTSSLAKGCRNAPMLYGDESVREPERITGIPSGLKAAGKVRTTLH
jgi:hypothetical protein